MSNFKFQKTVLAVSTTAAMAGMLVGGQAHAQAKVEQASIEVTAKIINSTCVLDLGGTPSSATTAYKKTLDLGTFSIANVSSMALLTEIGQGVSVVLSLKEANGTTAGCTAISSGKWDVLIDLPTTAYNTDTNLLNNTTTTGASGGMSAVIKRQINNTGTASSVNFSARSPIGLLVSGSTTGPNLASSDKVTVTAQMVRGYNTVAAGIYTAIVPLTVVYK